MPFTIDSNGCITEADIGTARTDGVVGGGQVNGTALRIVRESSNTHDTDILVNATTYMGGLEGMVSVWPM